MKWSLTIGKFWGTEIRLHVSLILLVPYAMLVFKPEDLANLLRVLLLLTAIFACVAFHEMGHTLAARLYGIQVTSIVLWPLGGFANLSRRPEKTFPDLVISAAGPLANLLLFVGLAVLTLAERWLERAVILPDLSRFLWQIDAFAFLAGLAVANLSLAVFNLVPVFPLDGGQIARGLLKLVFGEKRADLMMMVISLPLALALLIAGIVMRDIAIILTGLILGLASTTLNMRLWNGIALSALYVVDRASYYLKRSDFDPAVRSYTLAIERSPNRSGLYVSRAVAHMNMMEIEQARADIRRAVALDGHNFVARALEGELLCLDKPNAAALQMFDYAISLRPNWALGYLDRGSLYHDMGDLPRALADMNRAVELGPGSPISYVLRSRLYYQMGNLAAFQKDAQQALRYAPDWMLVFPELFQSGFEGHLNWSIAYFALAIEQFPKAYQSYQGRADACRANGRLDWAIENYDYAVHLAPERGEIYLSRGRAYTQLGQNEKAAADFHEAVRLADRAHIRRIAGTLLARLPKTSAAKETLAIEPGSMGPADQRPIVTRPAETGVPPEVVPSVPAAPSEPGGPPSQTVESAE